MISDYRQHYGLPSTQFLLSAGIDGSSHPRTSGHELGRMHHHRLQGSYPYPHPQLFHPLPLPLPHSQFHPHPLSPAQNHDLHEAMLWQIEKESIREEMIMSEMIRRRALEAEVRYEMMMERAIAIERGRNVFLSESPRPMGVDVPMRFPVAETRAEGSFLEERIKFPTPPRNALNNWREGGGSEAAPFQRAPIDERMARLSVVEPVLEASSGKNRMILQAKPVINIGAKKRAGESQSDGNSKKKVKEEWSCALCQVTVDTELVMNMHLAGKKHKRKEAALSARIARKINSRQAALKARKARKINSREAARNARKAWKKKISIPLITNKLADSMEGSETAGPTINGEVKLTSGSLLFGNYGDATAADGLRPLVVQETNRDIDVIMVDVAESQLGTNKVSECIKGSETSNPATDNEVKLTSESLLLGMKGDASSAADSLPPLDVQETNRDIGVIMVDVAESQLCTNKDADCIKGSEASNPATDNEVKLTSESLLLGKNGDASSAADGLPLLDVQETNRDIRMIMVDVAEFQLTTNKVAECIKGSETSNPAADNEVKLTSESLPYGNNGDANNSKKKKRTRKKNEPMKTFLCEICKVSMPHIQQTMDTHQQGKKHNRRAKLVDGTSAIGPFKWKAETEEQDGKKVKNEEENMT